MFKKYYCYRLTKDFEYPDPILRNLIWIRVRYLPDPNAENIVENNLTIKTIYPLENTDKVYLSFIHV